MTQKIILAILAADVPIPMGWVLAAFGGLATTISALAGIIWSTMKGRLERQDLIIDALQKDIDRLSKGCGVDACLWSKR